MAVSKTTPPGAGDGADITAPRARQAYLGRRVFWILAVSLAAVIAGMAMFYAVSPSLHAARQGGAANPPAPLEAPGSPAQPQGSETLKAPISPGAREPKS